MKKIIAFVFIAAFSAASLPAQSAGDFGAGAVAGVPTGATLKYWLGRTQALDAGLGFSSELTINADCLWHAWNVFPRPKQGKFPAYLGVGAQIRDTSRAEFGIRAVAGVAYWLPRNPVELFMEVVPLIRFTPNTGVDLYGGIGARYYFTESKEEPRAAEPE